MSFFNQKNQWKGEESHGRSALDDQRVVMSLSELTRKNPPNGIPMSISRPKVKKPGLFGLSSASNTQDDYVISSFQPKTPPILSSAPRVTIIDGKLVVDEESLVLDRPSFLDEQRERVEETSKWTTSASFRKCSPRNRWSEHDTQRFYQALKKFGTDFELISQSLANRTRAQVKNKFKREERQNPSLIATTLMRKP